MSLRDWFAARRSGQLVDTEREKREVADGLWTKCNSCQQPLFHKDLQANLGVCPHCGHHLRIGARDRLEQLLDPGTFRETNAELRSLDPLGFVDSKPYAQRLNENQLKTGLTESVVTGTGVIKGIPVAIAVMDFSFMGGSMGSVMGERFARAVEAACEARRPLVLVVASGGARMQEGTLALMQMAKTSVALARFAQQGLLYISVLSDPSTGGVTASFAMQADILLAEPGATIGFAGRRVIEATIRQKAPASFQSAEWVHKHGHVDQVVPRLKLRDTLGQLLQLHQVRQHDPATRVAQS